jgi:hypothetical protein
MTVLTASRRESRAIASQPLQLFTISLAPKADGKVEAEENPRAEGQWVLHRLRQQASHIVAIRCEVGQKSPHRLLDLVCRLGHRLRLSIDRPRLAKKQSAI